MLRFYDIDRGKATNPGISAWVSANAGSGKTTLLTRRVLRLLLAGVEPARVLCLTYTRAAAAEMLARVQKTAAEWAVLPKEMLEKSLADVLSETPSATVLERACGLFAVLIDHPIGLQMTTFHAFCQSVLKRFPLEAGVASYFQLLDERTQNELLHEALNRLYEAAEHYPPLESALAELASHMTEKSLRGVLQHCASKRRNLIGSKEALYAMLGLPPGCMRAAWIAEAFAYTPEQEAQLRAVATELAKGKDTDLRTSQALATWLTAPPDMRPSICGDYIESYFTKEGKPRQSLFTKNALTDAVLIKALSDEQKRIRDVRDTWECIQLAESSAAVLTVVQALLEQYTLLKQQRAVLDYDDLIAMTLRLLETPDISPWVMYKLDGGIDHILLDEAQDTSGDQWRILQALTQEYFAGQGRSEQTRTLFVVGDAKQSIYSFQGAELKQFPRMQAFFTAAAHAVAVPFPSLELPESFRSTAAVLNAVDAVCATPGSHVLTREGHGGRVECWPLVSTEIEQPQKYLAEAIAEQVSQWMTQETFPPQDVMVLLQKRAEMMPLLLRAFKRRGVPVAGVDRMALTENLVVQDLMSLGAFLLLPEDDYNLACLLKSPLCNISEDVLFTLAHGRGEASLWARLQTQGGEALAFLRALLAKTDYLKPYELYVYALEELGGRARIIGRMGAEYDEAIAEFLAQALAFEALHTPSLQGFLHWLEAGGAEIKRDMEQAGEVGVRIMTVHAAKGLEAPVVILADAAGVPHPNNYQQHPVLWLESEYGLAPLWPPSAKAAITADLKAMREAEEMAEYERLLYVAMTRARDRLYICGVAPRKQGRTNWHDRVWAAMEPIAGICETPIGPGLAIECPQEGKLPERIKHGLAEGSVTPEFMMQPVLAEKSLRLLTPSHMDNEALQPALPSHSTHFQRGVLLHQLLQYAPEVTAADRPAAMRRWLAHYAPEQPEAVREEMVRETLAVIEHPEYRIFFSAHSQAEVPLVGRVRLKGEEVMISGQVDRLVVTDDTVWVLDYKTHLHPPLNTRDIPLVYRNQMEAYQLLLKEIYPKHVIRCALLWTASLTLMPLDEVLVDS